MSPEQVLVPDQVDARSDLYSLGVVLYELLTGERPFRGTSSALLMQVVHDDPQPLRRLNPAVPRDLETICLKCLEKEPAKRYATAGALAEELQRFLAGEPIRARPVPFGERAVKWARRQPKVAALLAAVVLVTILGFAGVTSQWVRAETSRARAVDAANAAATSRTAAVLAADAAETARQAERAERDRVERLLYAHDISLAYHEYLTRNAPRAFQLLDGTRADLRNWEWRFLNRFCREELLTLSGHSAVVQNLVFSPDGELLASISRAPYLDKPGEVKVWDATSGAERYTLPGHAGWMVDVAFSPDSKRLVTTSARGAGGVRIWDAADGRELLTIALDGDAYSVEFSPDGRRLAIGQHNGKIVLRDSTNGAEVHTIAGHKGNVLDIALSPNGRRLATAGLDRQVRLWDLTSPVSQPSNLRVLPSGHHISDIAFSRDSRSLAVADRNDKTLLLWDLSTRRVSKRFQGHEGSITSVAVSPDGRRLLSSSEDKTLKLWDVATQKTLVTFQGHAGVATGVTFHPAGDRIVSAGNDRTVKVWDMETGKEVLTLEGRATENLCVASQADGRTTAAASADGVVQLWDPHTGKVLAEWRGHNGRITGLAFDPKGRLLASCGDDALIQLWDVAVAIDGQTEPYRVLRGHTAEVTTVSFTPDGERLASAGTDWTVKIWDVGAGHESLSIRNYVAPSFRVRFSSDGRLLALSGGTVVYVWDSGDKQPLLAPGDQGRRPAPSAPLHRPQVPIRRGRRPAPSAVSSPIRRGGRPAPSAGRFGGVGDRRRARCGHPACFCPCFICSHSSGVKSTSRACEPL